MKRDYIPLALLALLLGAGYSYFYAGGRVPAGQAPLRTITARNVEEVRSEFNAARDDARVLLLLSPT